MQIVSSTHGWPSWAITIRSFGNVRATSSNRYGRPNSSLLCSVKWPDGWIRIGMPSRSASAYTSIARESDGWKSWLAGETVIPRSRRSSLAARTSSTADVSVGSIPANPMSFWGNRLTYSATYRLGISARRYRLLKPRTIDLSTVDDWAQRWSGSAAGTDRQTLWVE